MDDYAQILFGENAKHVPMWMYVQNHGADLVSFIGASWIPNTGTEHPLRFGSQRTHQFVRGEMLIRPHMVLGTDALRGEGLGNLGKSHELERYLAQGEYIIGGE